MLKLALSNRSGIFFMKANVTALLASGLLLLGAAGVQAAIPDSATLYKSPSCLCCDGYAEHLESKGIDVELVDDQDLRQIKMDAGIAYGQGSCHTVMLGDYAIEGHVPFAALEKLFEERPDVDGIGLAGMPQGTPGMPGPQQAPYEIMSFKDREASPFLTL
jgi:hypothetical protein